MDTQKTTQSKRNTSNVIAILGIILILVGIWYAYAHRATRSPSASPVDVGTALTPGNTTTDIQNDLNTTPSPDVPNAELNKLNSNLRAF
ncbi:MAG: hypothetical protein KGI50_03155 [Patescibacteria group bacterium]|nr:hypothetical protein [Patescibacteria group bacterium]MDE2438289.1 hypothetical protein [Patescibacteria group bacterium]